MKQGIGIVRDKILKHQIFSYIRSAPLIGSLLCSIFPSDISTYFTDSCSGIRLLIEDEPYKTKNWTQIRIKALEPPENSLRTQKNYKTALEKQIILSLTQDQLDQFFSSEAFTSLDGQSQVGALRVITQKIIKRSAECVKTPYSSQSLQRSNCKLLFHSIDRLVRNKSRSIYPLQTQLIVDIEEAEAIIQLYPKKNALRKKINLILHRLLKNKEHLASADRDRLCRIVKFSDEWAWETFNQAQLYYHNKEWEKSLPKLFEISALLKNGIFLTACSQVKKHEFELQLLLMTVQAKIQLAAYQEALEFLDKFDALPFVFASDSTKALAQNMLFVKAFAFYKSGAYEEAQATIFELLSFFPNSGATLGNKPFTLLARISLADEKMPLAMRSSTQSIDHASSDSEKNDSRFLIGLVAYVNKDSNLLENSIAHLPESCHESKILRALKAYLTGHKDALVKLREITREFPENPFLNKILAHALIQNGTKLFFTKPTVSLESFKEALFLFSKKLPDIADLSKAFYTPSYEPESLETLILVLEPLLSITSSYNAQLEAQLKALITYFNLLYGTETELRFQTDQLGFDPFICHLELHLLLRNHKFHEAYTSFLNLRSSAPDYESLHHAWYQTAGALLDSSEFQPLGIELMTDLSEQKNTESAYPVIAQLYTLQKTQKNLLPEIDLIETPEDLFRLGLSELILAQQKADEGELRYDSHEVESLYNDALSLIDRSKNHLYESQDGSLHETGILLALLNGSSLELEILKNRAIKMRSATLEKDRILSCASWLDDIVSSFNEEKNTTVDPDSIMIGKYNAQFAKTFAQIATHDYRSSFQSIQDLYTTHRPEESSGSLEAAQLLLGRELMNQGLYQEALDALSTTSPRDRFFLNQDPSLLLEMAIERSVCYRELRMYPLAFSELSKVINSEYALSVRVQAALLRADLYIETKRLGLARKQLNAIRKKGGQWAILADKKLNDLQGSIEGSAQGTHHDCYHGYIHGSDPNL